MASKLNVRRRQRWTGAGALHRPDPGTVDLGAHTGPVRVPDPGAVDLGAHPGPVRVPDPGAVDLGPDPDDESSFNIVADAGTYVITDVIPSAGADRSPQPRPFRPHGRSEPPATISAALVRAR